MKSRRYYFLEQNSGGIVIRDVIPVALRGAYKRLVRNLEIEKGKGNWIHRDEAMESLLGLLRIRVKRGVNLAVRDVRSSDPYVVVKLGPQRLKTRVIKRDVNPEWNEDLTLSISDPNASIKLIVYDHDTFTKDDKMGDAEFSISKFVEALRMSYHSVPNGTIVTRIEPDKDNCLAQESCIMWYDGRVVQDLFLRLQNVECGEVELQLNWISLPGVRGL